MAKKFSELSQTHIDFIEQQHMFFVGTAGAEGYVNVSPKGMDSFRILGPGEVLWLNVTGSGNESAAHVLENARMTVMFCSFDQQPLILRLYGDAQVVHPDDAQWPALFGHFPALPGARQIFRLSLKMVMTSCGFGVPFYEFSGDRPTLRNWAEKKGQGEIEAYWQEKNTVSLDGRETGIFRT